MKKFALALAALLLTAEAFSDEIIFQYYLPSAFGFVSGGGSILNQFEDTEVFSRVLIPIEGRTNICSFGKFTLAFGFIATGYIENQQFGSMDASVGTGLYYNGDSPNKLSGWNLFLYPMYDMPMYAEGRKALVNWKSALDCGYTFSIDPIPFSITLFERNIVFWRQYQINYAVDFGISVGIYVKRPEY